MKASVQELDGRSDDQVENQATNPIRVCRGGEQPVRPCVAVGLYKGAFRVNRIHHALDVLGEFLPREDCPFPTDPKLPSRSDPGG